MVWCPWNTEKRLTSQLEREDKRPLQGRVLTILNKLLYDVLKGRGVKLCHFVQNVEKK